MNVWPPTVIVPDRELLLEFAATLKETVPLPDPEPEVMVIHPAVVLADHEQPLWVETVKLPEPPPEPKDWLV